MSIGQIVSLRIVILLSADDCFDVVHQYKVNKIVVSSFLIS